MTPTRWPGRLAERGLGLVGGYLELPFSEPEKLTAALPNLDVLLDIFDTRRGDGALRRSRRWPTPDLRSRSRYPGRAALDRECRAGRRGVGAGSPMGSAQAVERCRERGYDPTFHHHTATYIEAQWEIERLLEISDVGPVPGHRTPAARPRRAGDGDPRLGGRINQVHLKDARLAKLEEIVAEAAPVEEIWRRKAFCALGDGDIDVAQVLEALDRDRLLGLARGGAGRAPGSGQPRTTRRGPAAQPRVPARAWPLSRSRIALVGAGRMGAVHLAALQSAPKAMRAGRRRRAGRRATGRSRGGRTGS